MNIIVQSKYLWIWVSETKHAISNRGERIENECGEIYLLSISMKNKNCIQNNFKKLIFMVNINSAFHTKIILYNINAVYSIFRFDIYKMTID